MVARCSVQGCNNNGKHKKEDTVITFHSFPSNPENKVQWLRAIGRPAWNPSIHARICSAHFHLDQMNIDGSRKRIKPNAVPVLALPVNSNFDASDLEVCRFCLATDIKMYDLRDGTLRTCLESIPGFNDTHIGGLPQFACFECAAGLLKWYRLLGKSMTVQATLLDIFVQHGEITKALIDKQDRQQLNLASSLRYERNTNYLCMENKSNYSTTALSSNVVNAKHESSNCNAYKLYNDFDDTTAIVKTEDSKYNIGINVDIEGSSEFGAFDKDKGSTEENRSKQMFIEQVNKVELRHCIDHDDYKRGLFRDDDSNQELVNSEIIKNFVPDVTYSCDKCNLNFNTEGARRVHLLTSTQHKKDTNLRDSVQLSNICRTCGAQFPSSPSLVAHRRAEHPRELTKRGQTPGDNYPTPCEHCGEVVGSRREHWAHRQRAHPRAAYRPVVRAVCHCCGKGFQSLSKLRCHMLRHSGSRVSCAKCGRSFPDGQALRRHGRTHGARLHECSRCPRTFAHRHALQRHTRVHTGATPYECPICKKKFKHSPTVKLHIRTVHYKMPHPPKKKRTLRNEKSPAID